MMTDQAQRLSYRGRLAPSPTGYLHLGHARTFWVAQQRASAGGGTLLLRIDDLDRARCKPQFVAALFEDLRWFGLRWQEGPDCGGPHAPYNQARRFPVYRAALQKLRENGLIYPCTCSRKDIQAAINAPHAVDDEEPIYPGNCRPIPGVRGQVPGIRSQVSGKSVRSGERTPDTSHLAPDSPPGTRTNWRFRVPDGETISFIDGNFGPQQFVAGKDFGDFLVWRSDDTPSYQLACAVDDAAMAITEVVRGADLLLSTARQLLLYRSLTLHPPAFYHCELTTDSQGVRLAKRHDALSLRKLRLSGAMPGELRIQSSERAG